MAAADYVLVIGDKNFSSWSLRPWLALKQGGIAFDEVCVRLRQPESKAAILKHSPAGKVPILKAGDLVIWDSLAILEFLAEQHPDSRLWPADADARAEARAVSAEMHAGFPAVRNDMSMDLLARLPAPPYSDALRAEIARIVEIWTGARARYGSGGPFLFGAFCNADAMFAPVATRFRTYGVDLSAFGDDGSAQAYAETLLALPAMAAWTDGAEAEMKARAASYACATT